MVEEIPGQDLVSRHVDSPHKWSRAERQFVEKELFAFPRGEPESLVWRKYAPSVDEVHAFGCARQGTKRETNPNWTYEGALTATVANVRGITNCVGDRFLVEHAPDEGLHHAHVCLALAAGTANLTHRKADLKEFLRKVFVADGIAQHECV